MSDVTYAMTSWPIEANIYRDGKYWGNMIAGNDQKMPLINLVYANTGLDSDVIQVRIPEYSVARQIKLLAQLEWRPF